MDEAAANFRGTAMIQNVHRDAKGLAAVLLAAVVAAALTPAARTAAGAAGVEARTIANAGFEAGSGTDAAGWHWWSRTKHGAAEWTDQERHSGSRSVCLRHDGPRDWAFSSDTQLPVRPGEHFRASAWVKARTGSVTLAVVALAKGQTLSWDIGSQRTGPVGNWVRLDAGASVPKEADAICLRFVGDANTLAWVDDVAVAPWTPPAPQPRPKVKGYAFDGRRVAERLDRGLIARALPGGKVYLGWRLLASDPPGVAFRVHRRVAGGERTLLAERPAGGTTDFVDASAPAGKPCTYTVCPAAGDKAGPDSEPVAITPGAEPSAYVAVKLGGDYTFQKAGIADLDGDGRYDYVLKQPGDNIDPYEKYWKKSPDTYKLEACRHDGTLLWRHDMGWAIERGIWYSPYVVWDLDGDGRAEVAVKTGPGDPRDADGRVQSGPEHLTILDGRTGKQVAQADWPDRKDFPSYNYASRNQLGVAYLDGKTPCLIVERGTYNVILVDAYEFHGGKLRRLWRWDNRKLPRTYWGQGAHWMHCADVDGDGRDEVLLGSATLDDDGGELWTTGLGHPDHFYLGDLVPARPGLEIYYGMETRQKRNGMCMACARTGELLWGFDQPTRHVHGQGLCSDLSAEHPGSECYSADTDAQKKFAFARLHAADGKEIGRENIGGFNPYAAFWNADPQRELIVRGRIGTLAGLGKADLGRIDGRLVAIADILGDWREEVVTSLPGEMRIYTTTIPAADRRCCLMQDPVYRIDVAHAAMGYFQPPMLSYDVATRKPSR